MSKDFKNKLAIVIPAYKKIFFQQTLESISNQTNKDFTLYIGDDCSPDNLREIIEPFTNNITIIYKRFKNNLGNKDLVAQWHRCIDMVSDEEWIWLFSDDDVMDCNCIENFYTEVNKNIQCNLYHFNVTRIDYTGRVILLESEYPSDLSSIDFINKLINFKITSYVVEYIFNYKHFKRLGGFEIFDMAWGSDHATWLKLSFGGAIKTIPYAQVRWRSSGYNITSINDNKMISERKRNSELNFYKWLVDFFSEKSVPLPFSRFSAIRWFVQGIIIYMSRYGFKKVPRWIYKFSMILGGNILKLKCYFWLMFYTGRFYSKKYKTTKSYP